MTRGLVRSIPPDSETEFDRLSSDEEAEALNRPSGSEEPQAPFYELGVSVSFSLLISHRLMH